MNYIKSAVKYFILTFLFSLSMVSRNFAMKTSQNNLSKQHKLEFLYGVDFSHDGHIAISPFGTHVTYSFKNKAVVYNIEEKKQICSYKHDDKIYSVAFSASSRYLALVAEDGKVIIYDIEKKEQICSYQHNSYVYSVIFSPSGKYITSGAEDGKVIVYDVEKKEQICPYQYNGGVYSVAFSPLGKYIALGGEDGKIILYDIEKKKQIGSYQHDDDVYSINFSSSGKYIVSGLKGGKVVVYDIEEKKQICSYQHNAYVECVVFSSSDRYVASGSGDKKVVVYDIEKKQQICSYQHNYEVECVVFGSPSPSLGGQQLLSVDSKGQMQVWQLPENFQVKESLRARVSFAQQEEIIKSEITTTINMNNKKLFCFTNLFAVERNRERMEKKMILTEKLKKQIKQQTQHLNKIKRALQRCICMLPELKLEKELQASRVEAVEGKLEKVYTIVRKTINAKEGYKENTWPKDFEMFFNWYFRSYGKTCFTRKITRSEKQRLENKVLETKAECITQKQRKWTTEKTIKKVEADIKVLYAKQETLMLKKRRIQRELWDLWPAQKKEQSKEIGKKQEQNLEHVLRGVIVSPIDPNPHAGLSKPSFLVQFDNAKKLTVCNAFPEVVSKLKKNMNVFINPKTMMIVGHTL